MRKVLITGSNRGIGLELVRQYAAEGWKVFATCRNPISVGPLSQLGGKINTYWLDVADELQVKRLANELNEVSLDVIINNAGIYGSRPQTYDNLDIAEWLKVFQTNTIAPLTVSSHFLPHVMRTQGKIATLTSKMGSVSENSSGGSYIYRSSKSALNSIMKSLSKDLYSKSVAVCVLHPGWVKTEMGGPNAQISVETSAIGLRKVIEELTLSNSGKFFNYDGSEIFW